MKQVLLALSWYHPQIHAGVARFAREANWHLHAYMAYNPQLFPVGWQGDGIICSTAHGPLVEQLIQESGAEVSYVGGSQTTDCSPQVSNDDEAIARLAAEHLLAAGAAQFISFGHPGHPRHDYFAQSVPTKTYHRLERLPGQDWPALLAQLRTIQLGADLLGVFCLDDNLAAEFIAAADSLDWSIPENCIVVGVRNDPLICEGSVLSISSVDNALDEVGYQAAQNLERLMQGERVEPSTKVAPRGVVVRRSSDYVGFADPDLNEALRFIRQHFHQFITVPDVLHQVGVSERKLYQLFNDFVGHSIAVEINRLRIQKAKRLLVTEKWTMREIATQCGFLKLNTFFAVFKKRTGQTPGQFRKQTS